MKIGVISDTHSLEIPKQVLKDLAMVDLIIHAGDFCCYQDYQDLKKIADIKAVYGNMDDTKLRQLLPEKEIFEVEGVSIGLFHGEGAPPQVLESVKAKFSKDNVDVVIFGHSHHPLKEQTETTLFFNPGSPNDITFAPYQSYGILELNKGKIKASIIKIKA